MKFSAREAASAVNAPKLLPHAVLLYGPEPDLVNQRQALLLEQLRRLGEDGELRQIDKADARRDPAMVADARMESGLFGGRPIILIDAITDAFSKPLTTILDQTADNPGWLLLTAGSLSPKSTLRGLAEAHAAIACLPCYDDSTPAERIDNALKRHRLPRLNADALALLIDRMGEADMGSLDQCLQKLAIWLGTPLPTEVLAPDIEAVTPPTGDADTDGLITAILLGNVRGLPVALLRLQAQGESPGGLLAIFAWQFRRFHRLMILAATSSIEAALSAQRPPLAQQQRKSYERAARVWTISLVEEGLRLIAETEAQLRSGLNYPEAALVERCLIRIAALTASNRR